MGHCGYYRRFIYMYAEIAKPLYGLLIIFEWKEDCEESFQKLKQALVSAPILRAAPKWDEVFHVHIDASAFAIGCILAQPGKKNMDFPISYASRQMNSVERNYTTIEREGLSMVYAVKKFRHYLLANKFVFFVDHQALLYLVNKPCATGRIVQWFVILLEFDFTVAIKKGSTHQRDDHLSRITSREAPTRVDEDIPDATLFQTTPYWARPIVTFLSTGFVLDSNSFPSKLALVEESRDYQLISGRLYKLFPDEILCLVPNLEDYEEILSSTHISIRGIHFSGKNTAKRVQFKGYWWPNLTKDCEEFVQKCSTCSSNEPSQFTTLYMVQVNPNWSCYVENYLKNGRALEAPMH